MPGRIQTVVHGDPVGPRVDDGLETAVVLEHQMMYTRPPSLMRFGPAWSLLVVLVFKQFYLFPLSHYE